MILGLILLAVLFVALLAIDIANIWVAGYVADVDLVIEALERDFRDLPKMEPRRRKI